MSNEVLGFLGALGFIVFIFIGYIISKKAAKALGGIERIKRGDG